MTSELMQPVGEDRSTWPEHWLAWQRPAWQDWPPAAQYPAVVRALSWATGLTLLTSTMVGALAGLG